MTIPDPTAEQIRAVQRLLIDAALASMGLSVQEQFYARLNDLEEVAGCQLPAVRHQLALLCERNGLQPLIAPSPAGGDDSPKELGPREPHTPERRPRGRPPKAGRALPGPARPEGPDDDA